MSSLIAVADPDPATRTDISRALTAAEFSVVESGDGMHALRQVFAAQPTAIVMELKLPLLGGLELVRVLRAATDVAIIVMTDAPTPQLTGRVLDAGADHVIAHPVHPVDLVARVRASIRRAQQAAATHQSASQVIRTGALTIDREAQVVTRRGVTVPMTRTEHLLIDAMAHRVGQLSPHRYLLTSVWGGEYVDDTHYLRGYIASLRQKLEDDPSNPRLLLTEWGTGYRLAALPPEAQGASDAADDEEGAPGDGDGDRADAKRFTVVAAS